MKVTRREFGSIAGALGLVLPAQLDPSSEESLRALLRARGGPGIFEDPDWFALLQTAVELESRTGEALRAYPIAGDAEPALTFERD